MNGMHIETAGDGPDLVMLHGWAMHSGIWDSVAARLQSRFRLHRIDLPGHGLSRDCRLDTLDGVVSRIAAQLPERCIVCGWSLGGQIAIKLALRAPERVHQLVLVATTPCFVKRVDWPWGMEPLTLQYFMENLARDYQQTLSRFLTLQVRGGVDQSKVLAQLRSSLLQRAQPEPNALRAGLQILLTNDLRAELKEIMQPVLLIHGENDVITPIAAANWMQQQFRQAQLKAIPHCGHAPFLSFPGLFTDCFDALRSYP
ncbi:MAG TPA: pimeloyl-ACP methyl ester esterase BioH [Nitrosomonas halophila]|nr:pimeloyl-ACP methyl ester esterase BioH [Nitrosomonas halophila]